MAIKGYVDPKSLAKEEWIWFSNGEHMFPQNYHLKDFYWEMKQHFRLGILWRFDYEPQVATKIGINICELSLTNEILIDIFKRYNMEEIK